MRKILICMLAVFAALNVQCGKSKENATDATSEEELEPNEKDYNESSEDVIIQKTFDPEAKKPRFYEIPIKGMMPLETFDFDLDKFIKRQFGEELIHDNKRLSYKRYGIPEFYQLTEMVRPTDTIMGIICPDLNPYSQPRYLFTNKTDTLNYDIDNDNYRHRIPEEYRGTDISIDESPDNDSLDIHFRLYPIGDSEPFRLLMADSLDKLPEEYWSPYAERGVSDYVVKIYVKDYIVRRAEVMRIYDTRVRFDYARRHIIRR